MSSFPAARIRSALSSKGFRLDETHHSLYWLTVAGRKRSIRTRVSHGTRDYGDNLLAQMARQMGLRRRELDEFISCPMTYETYVELLIERGALEL